MIKLLIPMFAIASALCAQEREALAALEIAERLIDVDPEASLVLAKHTADADWSRRKWFWPVMLRAEIKLKEWDAAEALGAEAVREIDAGRLDDEIRFRRWYADALDHLHRVDEARKQRSILEAHAKAATLAAEIHEPPLPQLKFTAQYKGKVAIVLYWATWCTPCIGELDQLNVAYPNLRTRAEIVAVNADDSVSVIADFAKKHGYAFPAIASKEPLSTIPQLFVLDREGIVRFHINGFDDDGLFAQRLEWMVTAVAPAQH
jgi:thiol-disulfide isomerase/thioredoxin